MTSIIHLKDKLRTAAAPFTIPCPVCNGEGYVVVWAYNGDQTEFTALCPNCAGFGRVGREDEEMSESPGGYRASGRME